MVVVVVVELCDSFQLRGDAICNVNPPYYRNPISSDKVLTGPCGIYNTQRRGRSKFTAGSDYRTKRNGTQVFKISTDFQKETGLSYNYSVVTITCARAFFFLPLLRCCHVPKQQIVGARLSRGKVWSFLKKQLPALCFCRNEHRRTNAHFKAAVIFPRQLGPGMS